MSTREAARDRRHLRLMVVGDVCLFVCAYAVAYLIRFEGEIPGQHWIVFQMTLAPMVLCKMVAAHWFGLYRGMWRYTSLVDLVNVFKASVAGSLVIFSGMLFLGTSIGFSRATLLLDCLLTFLFLCGLRVGIRLYFTHTLRQLLAQDAFRSLRQERAENNLLIIGAGNEGEAILRDVQHNRSARYNVVGFLDDDPVRIGKYIHGVPVLKEITALREVVELEAVTEVLVAKPAATALEMRRIVDVCEDIGVKCRTIPSAGAVLDGKVTIQAVRDVSLEDLLGREPAQLETDRIGGYLTGKRVLVTGAGGSIGSELCRQICRFNPGHLVLLDRSESPLYDMEMELTHSSKLNVPHTPVLAGVQNEELMRTVFDRHRPQVVFHAAAYKHVPMLELQPWEAVFNNIIGTKNVLALCNEFEETKRFVLVSTDKAVRPTNVMGATKRIAELLTQRYDAVNNHTMHQSVRFGNVVGSAGSVVPLFKKQIEKGGPVTVTHPEVTRYFMTIPEATQLILQAGAMGEGGEIFILEMGTPVKIIDLARDLIRLSGYEPDEDIPIKVVGLRPGEKLYEELITSGEGIVPTEHQKIMVLKANDCGETGGAALYPELEDGIAKLVELSRRQDGAGIRSELQHLVPEYAPAENGAQPAAAEPPQEPPA